MLAGEAHRMLTVKVRKRMYRLHVPGRLLAKAQQTDSQASGLCAFPKPTLWVSPCHDKDVRAVEHNSKPVCRARWRVHQEVGKDGRHW
jgi:hypothetical protein